MREFLKRIESPLVVSLCVGALVALAVIFVRATGSLQPVELIAYDWQVRLQKGNNQEEQPIAIIEATESDIQRLRWPLSDATLAQAVLKLIEYKPRAIGLDIYRDMIVPPESEKLDAILAGNSQVIATMKFPDQNKPGVPPPPVLAGTEQIGFNDIVVDRDGIVRRGLLYLDDGNTVFHSFALRLALLSLKKDRIIPQPESPDSPNLMLGKTIIRPFESNDGAYIRADARGYQFLLDYADARRRWPLYDLTALLSGAIKPAAINDKIVLIGVTAESVPDVFHTPITSGLQDADKIHGVVLHANIVSQLLRFGLSRSRPITTAAEYQEWFWIALWSVMGAVVGLRVRSPSRFSIIIGSGLLLLVVFSLLAFSASWWIPMVPPALAWFTSAMIVTAYMSNVEKVQRGVLMQLFARHLSPEVAETIWQQRDEFLQGGRPKPQQITVTVLFTDLVNFTSVSEKKTPDALLAWLNEYMEQMAKKVSEHGGIINKYIGDSVMALFGAPLPRRTDSEIGNDAVNAVRCALHMARELLELNRQWEEQNLPMVGMRIGIFTGPVVVGSLGGTERLEYTVIGDTVNTASRLEGFDKELFASDYRNNACRILVGETTQRYLGNEFKVERVGEVFLKGKEQKLTVYNVVAGVRDSAGTLKEGR